MESLPAKRRACKCHAITKNIRHRYGPRPWDRDICKAFYELVLGADMDITKKNGICYCTRCGRVLCSECVLWNNVWDNKEKDKKLAEKYL